MPGSGAMGATLGILEFLSQTNKNADFIPIQYQYKFVDDLSTLEIINLVNIGMSSLNVKYQVPSDLPIHGQYISSTNLKSQEYLNKLNEWSENHQMIISQEKTKARIFNFTDKYKFTTRLSLKNKNIEITDQMKLLGTIVTDKNCDNLIKIGIKTVII